MFPTEPLLGAVNRYYRARTRWPPDISMKSEKEQLLMELKYKRRTKLKYTRPNWVRGIKLAQFGIISFTLGYGLLWSDWGDEKNPPFQSLRKWVKDSADSMWSSSPARRDVLKREPEVYARGAGSDSQAK